MMKKMIALTTCSLLAILAAQPPAEAGRVADRPDAVQVKQGMAAFKRYDYAVANLLLGRPARHGDSRAQAILCFLHSYGRGVPQSYHEASEWCRRSAEQGNPQGQYMLGLLYNKGQGVEENFVQAYKWINLAAANSSGPKRQYTYRIRDAVASKMSPWQIEKAQALSVQWQPTPEK